MELRIYRPDGTKRIADGTLVALTLMIAESRMDEMDILVKVVVENSKGMKKYVYSEAKQVVVCGDFAGASVELCQGC